MFSRLVDEIVWVKMTVNRRLAKSHGYYLQHAKEVCLVGKKGRDPPGMKVSTRLACEMCMHAKMVETAFRRVGIGSLLGWHLTHLLYGTSAVERKG